MVQVVGLGETRELVATTCALLLTSNTICPKQCNRRVSEFVWLSARSDLSPHTNPTYRNLHTHCSCVLSTKCNVSTRLSYMCALLLATIHRWSSIQLNWSTRDKYGNGSASKYPTFPPTNNQFHAYFSFLGICGFFDSYWLRLLIHMWLRINSQSNRRCLILLSFL